LKAADVELDRKILSQLAETEPLSFRAILLTMDTLRTPELEPTRYYNFPSPPVA
jgi:hypothetical protein